MYDLDLNENMMEKISRIGLSSQTRPRPLRVQLRDEGCASLFLNATYKLKFIRCWSNLSISLDRSADEHKTHQNLLKEFKKHRDVSEQVRFVTDKIVPVKSNKGSYS